LRATPSGVRRLDRKTNAAGQQPRGPRHVEVEDRCGEESAGVKRFKFELLDTSREPGVCLNWPLGAKDQDFDLRLAAESGGQLSDADQKLKIADPPKDDQERPYAEARIDSYDLGEGLRSRWSASWRTAAKSSAS